MVPCRCCQTMEGSGHKSRMKAGLRMLQMHTKEIEGIGHEGDWPESLDISMTTVLHILRLLTRKETQCRVSTGSRRYIPCDRTSPSLTNIFSCPVTSSVNTYFGSHVVGSSSGIGTLTFSSLPHDPVPCFSVEQPDGRFRDSL